MGADKRDVKTHLDILWYGIKFINYLLIENLSITQTTYTTYYHIIRETLSGEIFDILLQKGCEGKLSPFKTRPT